MNGSCPDCGVEPGRWDAPGVMADLNRLIRDAVWSSRQRRWVKR